MISPANDPAAEFANSLFVAPIAIAFDADLRDIDIFARKAVGNFLQMAVLYLLSLRLELHFKLSTKAS